MIAAPDVYPVHPDADQKTLRQLGALAHQARAALRAADRFVAQDHGQSTEIAGWLVCTAMELAHEVARVALRYGGVLSGEHGIGLTKRDFMAEALDPQSLQALYHLKQLLDPQALLNPGKLLPPVTVL